MERYPKNFNWYMLMQNQENWNFEWKGSSRSEGGSRIEENWNFEWYLLRPPSLLSSFFWVWLFRGRLRNKGTTHWSTWDFGFQVLVFWFWSRKCKLRLVNKKSSLSFHLHPCFPKSKIQNHLHWPISCFLSSSPLFHSLLSCPDL